MIGHGRSNAIAIKHGIRAAAEFFTSGVNEKIEAELRALGARKEARRPAAAERRVSRRLRLPRPGLAEGGHGPRAGRGLPGEPRGLRRRRRGPGLPALAALLRGAGERPAAHRQHPARHPGRRAWPPSRALARGACAPTGWPGHSLGEYSALVAAGAPRLRGRGGGRAPPRRSTCRRRCRWGRGAMAAILALDLAAVEEACRGGGPGRRSWRPANINSPGQVVIAGHAAPWSGPWRPARPRAPSARCGCPCPRPSTAR